MARPITWTDVAAPRGLSVAIEAYGRGGDRLAQAFGNMGQIAEDFRNDKIKAATDAVVADIANSDDPEAAAAAIAKDWKIDPLQVAAAANSRATQLLDKKAKTTDIAADELQMQNTRSELADRESKRYIATLVAPYEALARAGKDFDVDESSDPMWQTPAGFEAKKYLDGLKETAFNQGQERQRTALQATQARLAQVQLNEAMARKKAQDMWADYKLSEQGMLGDPILDTQAARQIGVASGAGPAYGLSLAPTPTTGATEDQKRRQTAFGFTYGDALSAIDTEVNRKKEAAAVSDTLTQIQGAAALADKENDYTQKTPEALVQAIIDKNPRITDRFLGFGMENDDVQTRYDYQGTLARKEVERVAKKYNLPIPKELQGENAAILSPQQQASLAAMTLDDISVISDKEDSPAAAAMREKYIALNLSGGRQAFEQRQAAAKAAQEKEVADLLRLRRQTEISAIKGDKIPTKAVGYTLDTLQQLGK